MKIIQNLLEVREPTGKFPPVGLTIGNFDGVHLGHRQLLTRIQADCRKKGLLFAVITFIPHPQKILQPEKERFLLNSYTLRRDLLKEMGVEYLIEMSFTRDFSTMKPQEFLKNCLMSYPELRQLYLGYDFAFGANKEGSHSLVESFCSPMGITVETQPKYEFDGNVVSSSLIRQLVLSGGVADAAKYLARPFRLEGVVVKGEGRGRKIGFPTANIHVSADLLVPQKGVYVTRTVYKGMTYKSVTNIGANPTFNSTENLHIETNIFDFDTDIYGEMLEIQFLHKIRDEKKFPTVNDLISQIKADVEMARLWND